MELRERHQFVVVVDRRRGIATAGNLMLAPFFRCGMAAPGRQLAFRRTVVIHVLFLASLIWALERSSSANTLVLVGHALLAAGIVEGAVLVGWRLTQLPKSQALEFLLASPMRPSLVFTAEALVGLGRLVLVALAGVPLLLLMLFTGYIEPADLVPLLLLPLLWGAVAGIGLTVWAYETARIRKAGEWVALAGILVYLTVGVLAAEKLRSWLQALPTALGDPIYGALQALHNYNPFGLMQYWLDLRRDPAVAAERLSVLLIATALLLAILFGRAMLRLKGHFHDRHYRPISSQRAEQTERIGGRPLSWWAVRRVMEYSGRVNIWLAGGFGIVYAVYLIAGDHWPDWMGRLVFQIFERMGGAPLLATGLVVLTAVPAAFQYGLWDSSTQDRCRRLELLLLTELDAHDYWHAALSAAWKRGRGYFGVALILWVAMAVSGRAGAAQIAGSITAAVILWGLSFALGFLAFGSGVHSNGLGSLLTLGLPLLAFAALQTDQTLLAALVPPGAVYVALTQPPDWRWLLGPLLVAAVTLWLMRTALSRCEGDLRAWYNRNQGVKVLD